MSRLLLISKGAEHDSSAFKITSMYKNLTLNYKVFEEKGFNLIGDSAYSLRPYLPTPYDGAKPKTQEDVFNYHLSACNIYVECTFGDIYARWGIFGGHFVSNYKPLFQLLELYYIPIVF